jgi:hypothetical protein
MARAVRGWAVPLLLAALAGCHRSPATGGTGAREAARVWFEALLRQDWEKAYNSLHADSRAELSVEQFTHLARHQRSALGFEPEAVRLRFCDEKGAEATAHAVWTGRVGGRERSYRDAVALRRGPQGWVVVLPPSFGMAP